MKQILIILGLFASVTTFAQSPRIKLNQITKDTVKGSVLISSPSDSGMVYSRDFYIAYGADTVLILYGDTLAATSGIISSVFSDGVTITGNGTSGNELKVDTSTVISTIQGLVDTLSARGYLTTNETITLSGDVTGSGTTAITATVVDDSHNHIISNVDFLQDSLNAKANDSDLANYVTLSGTETITGAKTFSNTFIQSGGDANFDNNTLYVDATNNNVGIGTSSPSALMQLKSSLFQSNTVDFSLLDNAGNERTSIASTGQQRWYLSSTAAEVGKIEYATPNGGTGIVLWTGTTYGTYTDRFNMVNLGSSFMLGYGTGTSSYNDLVIESDGDVVIDNLGTGTVYSASGVLTNSDPSDANLKTDINDINYGLETIMNLKPKTYYFKNDTINTNLRFGFIAQDVAEVIPEAVGFAKNNEYMYLNKDAIYATYAKAIQEQQAIIETQEQKITDLETTIQALITRIENLENK